MKPPDPPPTPPPANKLSLIRASELAQYGYCRRAWWLATVQKLTPRNRTAQERGIRAHRRHADMVRAARRWRQTGLLLIGSGLILVIVLAWWWAG